MLSSYDTEAIEKSSRHRFRWLCILIIICTLIICFTGLAAIDTMIHLNAPVYIHMEPVPPPPGSL